MTSRAALVPAAVILLFLPAEDAFPRSHASPEILLQQDPSPRRPPRDDASDAEMGRVFTAIAAADGYQAILDVIEQHEDVIAGVRMVALAEEQLRSSSLTVEQRGLFVLIRQLSVDCRRRGAGPAGRLLAIRLIAGAALVADSPQQLANEMEKFSPLADDIDAQLVREALEAPGTTWPPALLPLMERLAVDWREHGALAAATRMAEAANAGAAVTTPPVSPVQGPNLVGHWRSTEIVFESARDEHLVIRADGSAETWTATASGRAPAKSGRWSSQGTSFSVDWEDGSQWSQSFTFHEGQLVFPNVPNRRKFWKRIE